MLRVIATIPPSKPMNGIVDYRSAGLLADMHIMRMKGMIADEDILHDNSTCRPQMIL